MGMPALSEVLSLKKAVNEVSQLVRDSAVKSGFGPCMMTLTGSEVLLHPLLSLIISLTGKEPNLLY